MSKQTSGSLSSTRSVNQNQWHLQIIHHYHKNIAFSPIQRKNLNLLTIDITLCTHALPDKPNHLLEFLNKQWSLKRDSFVIKLLIEAYTVDSKIFNCKIYENPKPILLFSQSRISVFCINADYGLYKCIRGSICDIFGGTHEAAGVGRSELLPTYSPVYK